MKILLPILRDSHNTYIQEGSVVEIERTGPTIQIRLVDSDRTVSVSADELKKVIEIISK